MKTTIITVACTGLLLTGTAFAGGHGTHWGYTGHEGPEFWGNLSNEYAVCKSGKNQAPINIGNLTESDLSPIAFHYSNTSPMDIVNNGHTIQVNYAPGSTITVDNHTFNLLQFHFHTPSENTVDGRSFAMESHLVHADKDGNLAVVGVLFEEGPANPFIDAVWAHMPGKAGEKKQIADVTLNATDMLPSEQSYYRFNGSLTTPPCSEGVRWMVMKNPVTVSKAQAEQFNSVIGGNNNRPVQPVNARPILE
ncbi:MAG: carbonic anhydrase family protein [Desulfocapsa sp.]|nr:carbonic anhydrase family protein [Desulfocapsa sp.]